MSGKHELAWNISKPSICKKHCFIQVASPVEVKQGYTILNEGDSDAREMYIIVKGYAALVLPPTCCLRCLLTKFFSRKRKLELAPSKL